MAVKASELTGTQRAAIVLVQLGRDVAGRILRSMSETEAISLTLEIARLPKIENDLNRQIADDFINSLAGIRNLTQGGVDTARDFLASRIGAQAAEEILDEFSGSQANNPVSFLAHVDAGQTASYLQDEHPQIVAVILSFLSPDTAAAILSALPDVSRADIARRIANMERVDPEVLELAASVLQRKLAGLAKAGQTSSRGGVSAVVEMLNRAEQNTEKRILSDLDAMDPELADRIRTQMFVFEDVMNLDDRTLQRILRQVVPKDLAVALKGVPNDMREKVLKNMSERAAGDLVDEIETLGAMRVSAVEAAQSAVVRVVRELESAGEIVLTRNDEEMI
ncbi:flagellar motor switch protein FliG [Acidithrix ferrooxidans]|uniref:Flagellar motor switch protein FliG n=1 Tax=Acidithrix ferrooxidans TaxID=1280514 RepID=A0A0D8HFB3_9ACTN|nr:flagellar motor switch protein FliG [Acidithrix ferrooxidans]